MDIATEEKYPRGVYKILDKDRKEIVKQTAREQYLAYAFICQSDRNRYIRLIKELERYQTKGDDK